MKTYNYYTDQLNKLNADTDIKIKLTDEDGNATNWITIKPEYLEELTELINYVAKK